MKPKILVCAFGVLLLAGCLTSTKSAGPAAAGVGAPVLPVDASILGRLQPSAATVAPVLPDRMMLPASYRLLLLDGRLALVRETDGQALEPAPVSLRIVTGEIAKGEIAYQPALLPQELAAQVAANRASAARMDAALGSVMARSKELSEQALALQAQSRRLTEMLSRAEAGSGKPQGAGTTPIPHETKPPADPFLEDH